MRKIILYQFLGIFFSITISFNGHCQMYNGGNGAGFNAGCYSQASNVFLSFFNGGNADGFYSNCYSQTDNTLLSFYYGGNGNGFAVNCYSQTDNVLLNYYYGGTGNGFSVSCYAQADNVLLNYYYGGNGNGFSVNCYSQADNALLNYYYGGSGSGFGNYCLGSGPNNVVGLPIELLLFNAIPYPDNVSVQWITASEINSDYFQIEKSRDANGFASIGKVKAAGNSSTRLDYNFSDEEPLLGRSYYRLKAVDFNGQYAYSNMIAVNYSSETNFTIYPNPSVQGDFYVVFSKRQESSTIKLAITNSLGQQILRKDFAVDKSGVIHIQQQKNLPEGIYNVNIWCDDFSNAQMLVIK